MYKDSSKETKISNGPVPNGHIANGKNANCLSPQKSVVIAYLLWLVGGIFGLHHIYLHRDRHAFVWWCTLGGYFGIGWLGEIFMIPEYVRDANEDPRFIKSFVEKLRAHPKPPYSAKRFMGEVMLGYLFGQLIQLAIPQTPFAGVDWYFLQWLVPPFIALGVWTVGNIGRECGVIKHSLISSVPTWLFMRYVSYDETYTLLVTAIVCALVFDRYSKEWLRRPPLRRGTKERTIKFIAALLVYFMLWGSFLYFNGTISDEEGGEVPIHEALRNFDPTALWADLVDSLKHTYQYAQHYGWYETMREIFDSMDMERESNSYRVLGISPLASQADITSAYRKLSKEFHPDKIRDEAQRAEANKRFIEIQQAYNMLSKVKSSRRRKNKKYTEGEAIVL